MVVLASVIVALSRPGWGRAGGDEQRAGRDLVLAIDTSRSMGCEDALPDRLGVAVKSAESLVRAIGQERADRAAVVAFAGRAVVRCPLTENLGAVVDVLHRLRAGDVSPGGTDLGRALAEGLAILDEPGETNAKVIVLFSDGEDHADTWESVLADVEQAGVVVFSVSVGDSEEGALVPDGSGGAVTWEGQPVRSRRVDEGLRTISEATGGRLFPAGRKPVDLAALERRISAPDLVARRRVRTGDYPERFPVFLGVATALAIWASRVPWRRARLLMMAVAVGGTSLAAVSPDARTAVDAGCRAWQRGDAEAALKAFEGAMRDEPEEALPRYDSAIALDVLGRFDEAVRRFDEAERLARSPVLKAKVAYARGNALVAAGRFQEAIFSYNTCLQRAGEEPTLSEIRRDAEINRAFALEHLPPPPDTEESPSGDGEKNQGNRTEPKESDEDGPKPKAASDGPVTRPEGGASGEEAGAEGPEGRLESALDRIQEGKDRRRTRPVDRSVETDRKDW